MGARFKKQLAELMSALHTMEPHYIRCIKPNSKNQPMDFENTNVLHQLRCGGVLEAVRPRHFLHIMFLRQHLDLPDEEEMAGLLQAIAIACFVNRQY